MEMCRVCLSTEKEMHPLDESFVIQYNILTSLNISLMDGMPQLTCETCLKSVIYFSQFREKSIASEATLRKIICSNVKAEVQVIGTNFESQNEKKNLQTYEESLEQSIKVIKEENCGDSDFVTDNFETTFEENECNKQNIIKMEEDERLKDIKLKKLKKRIRKKLKEKNAYNSVEINNLSKKCFCGICPRAFEEETDLNEHIDVHKEDRQCELCKEKVNSLSQLLAHRLTHVPPKQHKCHICNKRYKSCLYLEHHYRTVHVHSDDPEVTCKICLSSFSTPKKLSCHIFYVHSNDKYFCDFCSKGFRSKSNLNSHVQQHSMIKSFVCDLCGFSCNYRSGLKDHKIRKHSQSKMNCKNCSRAFLSQEELERHKCKVKIIICTICGLQLTGSSRMSSHMRCHSSVGKYECDRCPAKYKSKLALTVHKNRHEGNRTQQCEYCPAKFYTTTVLIKHRRIHTGEKPYVCKVCNKGFTGRHNLKVHMKVHGEYLIVKKNTETITSKNSVAK